MEDNTSTEQIVDNTSEPADDPILSTLSDTEDGDVETTPVEDNKVEETQEEESTEAEATQEAEQPKENTEEVEAEVDPKEEARRQYEARQAYKEERNKRIEEQTRSYKDEAADEYDKRLRDMEVQRYTELIENTESKLVNEFERVKSNPDLQIFNPESKNFDQKAYDRELRIFNKGSVNYDTNGNMVGLKDSLFEHLTEAAQLYQNAERSGAFKQVKNARTMKSNADPKPAAQPKEPQKDTVLDILMAD